MRLQMKITPLRTGTAEPADRSRLFPCPAGLDADQVRPFLVQFFGEEPVDLAWTTTARRERISIGWIFRALPAIWPTEDIELLCVPVIEAADGSHIPLFELVADQRQDAGQLAAVTASGASTRHARRSRRSPSRSASRAAGRRRGSRRRPTCH
jgi:hypothetical protein